MSMAVATTDKASESVKASDECPECLAGNLGWLPLTGITFPFASFGAWSLLANTLFLGLAMSLPRRA